MPIIIVGTRGRTIEDKGTNPITAVCRYCGELVAMQPVQHKRFLTLFFIPLIPLEKGKAAMQCPKCKTMFQRKESF